MQLWNIKFRFYKEETLIMEVVINTCYGGFNLLNKAVKRYYELKGQEVWFYKQIKYDFNRPVRKLNQV